MFRRDSYVPHRRLLYGLMWAIAVAELGLTAARLHFTNSNFGFHNKIVVELLVTSILTILWVPLTLLFHRTARGVNNNHNNTAGTTTHSRIGSRGHYGGLHHESSGNFVLWVMWLVGAAIAVHQFPNRLAAGPGKEGRILITIIALAFVEFGLMTLAKVLALMEYAALGATSRGFVGTGPGHTNAMSGKTGGNYTGPATTV